MKRTLSIYLFLILTLISCRHHAGNADSIVSKEDSSYAAYRNLARSLPDSFRFTAPFIYTSRDTDDTNGAEVLDSSYLAIGYVIDNFNIFAIACKNIDNDSAILKMYRLNQKKWKLIGEYDIPFYVALISERNFDSDRQRRELMLSSGPNMNANCRKWFFKYDARSDVFKHSGHIYGDDGGSEFDTEHSTVKVEYEGSWYMDQYKSLYLWYGDSLVLLREASMHIIDQAKAQKGIYNNQLEYMENKDTSYSGGLTTIFSERDNESSQHHKKYWDEFFDLK